MPAVPPVDNLRRDQFYESILRSIVNTFKPITMPDDESMPVMIYKLFNQVVGEIKFKDRLHFDNQLDLIFERNYTNLKQVNKEFFKFFQIQSKVEVQLGFGMKLFSMVNFFNSIYPDIDCFYNLVISKK